jgi:DnaJ family protein A protein 2
MKTIVVHITPGMSDGERIVFQGSADEAPDADPGDLIIHLDQKKHSRFHRKADDLLISKQITLTQALFGGALVVEHLDGRKLVIRSPFGQVIEPNSVKVIEHEGMPHRGNAYEKGKLFVRFEVVFPKASELSPELRAAFLAAIPAPDETRELDENDDNTYPVNMRDSSLAQFQQARTSTDGRRDAYNNDGDDQTMGQCQPM